MERAGLRGARLLGRTGVRTSRYTEAFHVRAG